MTSTRVIPCEKSEKKITEFVLDFRLEKSKVLVILGIKIPFFDFFWRFLTFLIDIFSEISTFVNLLK